MESYCVSAIWIQRGVIQRGKAGRGTFLHKNNTPSLETVAIEHHLSTRRVHREGSNLTRRWWSANELLSMNWTYFERRQSPAQRGTRSDPLSRSRLTSSAEGIALKNAAGNTVVTEAADVANGPVKILAWVDVWLSLCFNGSRKSPYN